MRKWLLHIAFILAAVTTAAGQAIAPDGITDWDNSHLITVNGDLAYAVTYDADKVYDLKRWDIGGWVDMGAITPLPKHGLNPDGEFVVVDIITFDQKVFVAGKYYIDLGGSAINYVASWNGTNWSAYTDTLVTNSADLNKFVILDNKLMLLGMFGGSPITSNVLQLGTNDQWIEFGDLLTHDEANDFINDVFVYNNFIYVSGGFKNGNNEIKNLASLQNETWVYESSVPFVNMTGNFASFKGNLVLYGEPGTGNTDYFYQWNGSNWSAISGGLDVIEVIGLNKIVEAGNYLWAAGEFKNLSTQETVSMMYYNGTSWNLAETGFISNDIVTLAIDGIPYVYGNFTYHDALNFGRVYPDKALISGRVYEDVDGNCTWSAGDRPVDNAMLELNPGGHLIFLNSDGTYYLPVDKGNYSLKVLRPDYWKSDCSETLSVQVMENITYSATNFGIAPIPGKVDLYAHLSDYNGWVLQSGKKDKIRLCVFNKGTADATNVEVVLYVDEKISSESFSPVPDQYDGTKAVWNISKIPAGSMQCFELTADMPGGALDELNFSYEINLPSGYDENGADNNGSTSFELTDKDIAPIYKAINSGETIDLNADELMYKIRIHNVGRSTVDRIVIRDTIDEDLYYTQFSHFYTFGEAHLWRHYEEKGNNYQYTYVWTFNNANLVDSATDQLASIGYLDMKFKLAKGLHPKGTQICNTAYVKADSNEIYRTNTVCGAFGLGIYDPVSDMLQIRPNPANKAITMTNPVAENMHVRIYSTEGRVVKELTLNPMETAEVEISELGAGVYFIQLDGYGATRFIKVD